MIAEQFLDDGSDHELQDYKFWCFNDTPTYMYITNKGRIVKENFYDMDFRPININHGFDRRFPEFDRPDNLDLMRSLAAVVSKDIPFVRVDFFDVCGRVYFGECTFYDWGGMRPFRDEKWDERLGEMIKLPNSQ